MASAERADAAVNAAACGDTAAGGVMNLESVGMRRPPRVLVAEEDDLARDRLSDALRGDGYEVIEAEDGFEVLDYLLSFPVTGDEGVDVIVADAQMPGYDGLEVLAKLRRMEIQTPFVLVNRTLDGIAYREAERLGADLVVASPEDVDEVRDAVFSLAQRY